MLSQLLSAPAAARPTSATHRSSSALRGATLAVGRAALLILTLPVALASQERFASLRPGRTVLAAERPVADLYARGGAVTRARYPLALYTGSDERGVPRYIGRAFTSEERRLLRAHFGVERPELLYVSEGGYLTYDTNADTGPKHFVRSYRVGGRSTRQVGESWEEFERRLRATPGATYPAHVTRTHTSLQTLHPEVREQFARMLADARAAGFRVRVTETYRSPERQAFLLGRWDGSTYTGTSAHSDGRAIDVVVGDGKLEHRATRVRWAEFRRWLLAYDQGQFRILGEADRSWDWPHVAIPGDQPGFSSIEDALDAALALDLGRL